MENWFSKLGKKIETAVSNAYPVGTTYYGGMSGAGNMNLSKIEHAANQMDPEEAKEFKKETNTALGVGTAAAVTLPFIANGIQAFRAAHPIISGVIDTGLTVDGVRNVLSDNGVNKTINYAKDGNLGRAAASGTIDALDLLGGVGLIGDVGKLIKKGMDWRFINRIMPEHNKATDFIFSEIVPARNLSLDVKQDLFRRLSLNVDRYRFSSKELIPDWFVTAGYATGDGKIRYNPLTSEFGSIAVHEGVHLLLFASGHLYPTLDATLNPVTKSIEYQRLGQSQSPILFDWTQSGIDADRLNAHARALPIRLRAKIDGTMPKYNHFDETWVDVPTYRKTSEFSLTHADDAMERDATLQQILYSISKLNNGAKGQDLTNIIENMPLWKLNWKLFTSNGYGTDYWLNNMLNRIITPITRLQLGRWLKDALIMRKSGGKLNYLNLFK